MFSPKVRLLIITACLVWGVFDLAAGQPTGYLFLTGAAFIALGHVRYGTVPLAVRAAKKGDLNKAERLLSQTAAPHRLSSQSRAYYDWLQGMIAAEKDDFSTAKRALERSLRGKLRTDNDRSLVLGLLASVCNESGNREDAHTYLAAARSLPRRPEADAVLDEISDALGPEGVTSVSS